MNKLTIAAFLSLAGLGLTAGDLLAWGRCGPCCLTYKVHCTQYNAFSPPCCMPCLKPSCFHRRLPLERCCHKPKKEPCCEPACCEPACEDACCSSGACSDGSCHSVESTPGSVPPSMPPANGQPEMIPGPNAPQVQAPAWNYPMQPAIAPGMYPQVPMHPMMAQGMYPQMPMHPMMAQGMYPQMPMHPMMAQGHPPMPMPMPYPGMMPQRAAYYPPPNQALIAPPGTIGMPPNGFPTMMPMPGQ